MLLYVMAYSRVSLESRVQPSATRSWTCSLSKQYMHENLQNKILLALAPLEYCTVCLHSFRFACGVLWAGSIAKCSSFLLFLYISSSISSEITAGTGMVPVILYHGIAICISPTVCVPSIALRNVDFNLNITQVHLHQQCKVSARVEHVRSI